MRNAPPSHIVKSAVVGRTLAALVGKGFTQSFKNFARSVKHTAGMVNQGVGYATRDPSRIARGAQTVANNTLPTISGKWYSPRATGQRLSRFWGARDAGAKGFLENAAYAAGRAPAILTYGGGLAFAPYVAGEYAGSAHGAASAAKNLKNVGYSEIARNAREIEKTPFMERMRYAYNPEQFAANTLLKGDAGDNYSLDAYNRMFNTDYQPTGGVGSLAKEFLFRSLPVGVFFEPQQGLIPGRDWIQNIAADKMAERVTSLLPPKKAACVDLDMLKQANIFSSILSGAAKYGGSLFKKMFSKPGVSRVSASPPPLPPKKLPPPLPGRVSPPPLPPKKLPPPLPGRAPLAPIAPSAAAYPSAGAFTLNAMKHLALPTAMGAGGYLVSKILTEKDLEQQAKGTARAAIANYWMELSPMERYLATAFPTAARMKMEQKLGPEYSKYYQQTYGPPGVP